MMKLIRYCEKCEIECLHTYKQTPSRFMILLDKIFTLGPEKENVKIVKECLICGHQENTTRKV